MLIRYSEIFKSVQGEGLYEGVPSIFVRLWGCNFTCSGFSNPKNVKLKHKEHLIGITKLERIDPSAFSQGCDSVYTWNKDFIHLSMQDEENVIAQKIVDLLPVNNKPSWDIGQTHLVFTGGEPLMNQKGVIAILEDLDFKDSTPTYITFETNTTQILKPGTIKYLNLWKSKKLGREIHFACSPKLSHSGEPSTKAINCEAFSSYVQLADKISLKFVVRPYVKDFDEAQAIYDTLTGPHRESNDQHERLEGSRSFPMYMMPLGGRLHQQRDIDRAVAKLCMDRGLRFCPRLHIYLYDNALGT